MRVRPLRHASEGWHPECATAHTVRRARVRVRPLRHASRASVRDSAHGGESEGEGEAPPSCQRRLASRCATAHTVRRARVRVRPLRHASEGWHPECATAHTVRRARVRVRSRVRVGVMPAKTGIQVRDSAHGGESEGEGEAPPSCQRRLASRCATAHTVRRTRVKVQSQGVYDGNDRK